MIIYESSDMFVAEYRTRLADRLVNSIGVDVEKEKHLLKLLIERLAKSRCASS